MDTDAQFVIPTLILWGITTTEAGLIHTSTFPAWGWSIFTSAPPTDGCGSPFSPSLRLAQNYEQSDPRPYGLSSGEWTLALMASIRQTARRGHGSRLGMAGA